jgi:hypothetical protein
MDNQRLNLTRNWMHFVSIAWYQERLVSLDEFTFFVRTTPSGRFFKLIVAFMDPFDIQIHVSWYHAIDTKYVHILVKFEHSLPTSVLRNKTFFTKKRLSHAFENFLFIFFSPKLKGQPAFKFGKYMDVLCIYCMIPRTPGLFGCVHFFGRYHSSRSLF